jgi:hypothetical protein
VETVKVEEKDCYWSSWSDWTCTYPCSNKSSLATRYPRLNFIYVKKKCFLSIFYKRNRMKIDNRHQYASWYPYPCILSGEYNETGDCSKCLKQWSSWSSWTGCNRRCDDPGFFRNRSCSIG